MKSTLPESMPAFAVRPTRPCIVCGAREGEPVFTYTYQFLVDVRGANRERLAERGWSEQTTSTIVRCKACGCKYVLDPFLNDYVAGVVEREADLTANLAAAEESRSRFEHHANYQYADHKNWIARTLVCRAAHRKRSDIAFLDFGAGSGTTANIVRSLGISNVVAYDPFYPPNIQDVFDHVNFPGIRCVRNRDDLTALGPFDAASFQSVVEHVVDPCGELAAIFALLSPGGLLYVNNPVMDLGRELSALRAAKTIRKQDRISHYHPNHLNYMMPREFERMVRGVGFEISPWTPYAPRPFGRDCWKMAIGTILKRAVRWSQNALHLPYDRYAYLLRKPG